MVRRMNSTNNVRRPRVTTYHGCRCGWVGCGEGEVREDPIFILLPLLVSFVVRCSLDPFVDQQQRLSFDSPIEK